MIYVYSLSSIRNQELTKYLICFLFHLNEIKKRKEYIDITTEIKTFGHKKNKRE